MGIEVSVSITGIEGWDMDWSDSEGVKMELVNIEEEIRHAIADRLGIPVGNVGAEAVMERP